MKPILYTIILICFVGINQIKAQSEFDIIIRNLNKIKEDKSKKSFIVDSALCETTKLIEKIDLNSKSVDKDSIRNILRSKGNYDYNIEYVEISISKTKNSDNILKELQNEKLSTILKDTLFNKLGVTIVNGFFKNKLKLIATQNYINFDDEFSMELQILPGGNKITNVISGNSKVDKIMFNTYFYDNSHQKIGHSKQPIIYEENNRFEIRIDITDYYEKPMDIEIIDSNGKTLSFIKNR